VFVKFLDGAVQLSFSGKGGNAEKSGGVITPNSGMVGLSRRIGPVGGSSESSLSVTARGQFDPAAFFAGALTEARILGGIRLVDILSPLAQGVADTLDQAPRLLRRAVNAAGDVIDKEGRLFYSALDPIIKTCLEAVSSLPFKTVGPRFARYLDPINSDLQSLPPLLDMLKKSEGGNDPYATFELEESIIALQGQIIAGVRDFMSEVNNVVRNPQTVLTAELQAWVDLVTEKLAEQLSGPLNAINTIITKGNEKFDQLAQDVANAVTSTIDQAGAQIAHSKEFKDAVLAVKARLSDAISKIDVSNLEKAATTVGQILTRVNEFRAQVRSITDAAYAEAAAAQQIIQDLTNFNVPAIGAKVLDDLNASLLAIEQGNPDAVGFRRTRLELIKAHQQLRDLTGVNLETIIAAQTQLLITAQAILPNPVLTPTVRQQILDSLTNFTCVTKINAAAIEATAQKLGYMAAGASVPLLRLGRQAAALVANLRAAMQNVNLSQITIDNIGKVITILENFRNAVGFLEKSADILGAASVAAGLKDAGAKLDSLKGKAVEISKQAEQIKSAFDALAQNAPVLLKNIIQQQVNRITAPLNQVAATVEEQAISILATFLADAAHFAADLLTRLEASAQDLTQLLDLKRQIEQAIAAILEPKVVELSYTWRPELKSSSRNIFRLEQPAPSGPKLGPRDHLLLTARIRSYIAPASGQAGISDYSITGRLNNFSINLFSAPDSGDTTEDPKRFISIFFDYVQFTSKNGGKPDCDVKIAKVDFGQALKFVKKIQEKLNPKSGAYLEVTPALIAAGYRFNLPDLRSGGFSMKNLRLDCSIVLPLTGDPARFRFRLSDRDNPFTLSVGIWGGAGWFSISLGMDGVDEIELGLEFGLAGDISIGVATGYGRVMGGLYVHFVRKVGTELSGFIDIAGHVDVVGLISLSMSVYYGVRYLPDTGDCYGEATVTVKIEMFFFDIEVQLHTSKRFSGDDHQGAVALNARSSSLRRSAGIGIAPMLDDDPGHCPPQPLMPLEDDRTLDWNAYAEAFAEI
jgi:hypothetical protein